MMHWQRLSKTHARGWLHIGRKCFGWEALCWSRRLGISLRHDDEDFTFGIHLPPFGLYLSWPSWRRIKEGEFQLSVHDWAIWFSLWGNLWEWSRKQPWWERTHSFDIPDFFLGRTKTTRETVREGIPVEIPMPEGVYRGMAKVERYNHKRPRWFARSRLSTWIEVPKGIPHSGKGENSWDCGDDGIWATGCEGDDPAKAVQHFRDSVMKNRKRYGCASDEAVKSALAACA